MERRLDDSLTGSATDTHTARNTTQTFSPLQYGGIFFLLLLLLRQPRPTAASSFSSPVFLFFFSDSQRSFLLVQSDALFCRRECFSLLRDVTLPHLGLSFLSFSGCLNSSCRPFLPRNVRYRNFFFISGLKASNKLSLSNFFLSAKYLIKIKICSDLSG